jgi:hypothetical protein
MKRVMYVSRARHRMTHGELTDLLLGARRRNEEHGITGILVYAAGNFAQVLEGPDEAIDRLLQNLHADPRHDDYRVIAEASVEARYFDGWSMDWADLDRFDESRYAELRDHLGRHGIGDRAAIYRAFVLFIEDHARARAYPEPRPAWPAWQTPAPAPRRG